jgi:hypothetical protein
MHYVAYYSLLISLTKNELYGLKHVLVNDIQMEAHTFLADRAEQIQQNVCTANKQTIKSHTINVQLIQYSLLYSSGLSFAVP